MSAEEKKKPWGIAGVDYAVRNGGAVLVEKQRIRRHVIFENEYYHPDSFPPRYGVKNPIVVHGRTIIIEGGCQESIIESDAGWIERERV